MLTMFLFAALFGKEKPTDLSKCTAYNIIYLIYIIKYNIFEI